MKPRIVYKTTAGLFKTQPKAWFYIAPRDGMMCNVSGHILFPCLCGVRQDANQELRDKMGIKQPIPCETD
jgi:hypothetical protein